MMNESMADPDVVAITDALVTRDVAAVVTRDWSMVADDFDASAFVGYRAEVGSQGWVLAYPTLDAYRDAWLRRAHELATAYGSDLEDQFPSAQRLSDVQVTAGRALARKEFDRVLTTTGDVPALGSVTTYFLQRAGTGRWLITGLVGHPAHTERSATGRIRHGQAPQHATAGPYAPSVTVSPGPIVVISGQGPLDGKGDLVGSDIETQTVVTLENCRHQLTEAGAGFSDVFKCTVYLSDLTLWDRFNAVYRAVVDQPFPVRTAVGAPLLLGMLVEIEMWAAP